MFAVEASLPTATEVRLPRANSHRHLRRRTILGAVACFLLAQIGVVGVISSSTTARTSQVGAPMVIINPGGGIGSNGSDGLKMLINSDGTSAAAVNATIVGQDQFYFANTYQYCCSAGAPMLSIGGALYGQAGPAGGGAATTWTTITVDHVTGSTTTSLDSPMGTSVGSGTATIHYTAVKNTLTYTIDRAISYTYPNSSASETYTFTIPTGNAEVVKFYLGGDTAPGSSDSGYGIMLTSPVRSVISLNTLSHIQFGMREVAGSKIFDGATSQSFSIPYGTVRTGGNIGYVVNASNHDAGLMVQWNLGSTPGTTTAALEEFVAYQEVGLAAQFREATFDIAIEEPFDFNLTNTLLTDSTGNGFTFTFPSGMSIGTGAQTNGCGGTLTATPGTDVVVVSGVSVNATSNCLITIPVGVAAPGVYAVGPTSVSGIAGDIVNRVANSSVSATTSNNSPPQWVDNFLGSMATIAYYNDGVVASGWPLPTFAVTPGTLPGGLTLDPATGTITGTPTSIGSYAFGIEASNLLGSITAQFGGTVFAEPTAPTWIDQALGDMQTNVAYIEGVTAIGFPTPTYAVTAGTLPAGLSLNAVTGAVTGTPSAAGPYSFTIEAGNSVGSITATFSGTIGVPAPTPEGLGLVALTPVRALDTRDGGHVVTAFSTTELSLAGQFGVPANTGAVALNVTVDDTATAGYLTVYPCGTTRPYASNVNFTAGEATSNAVTVYLGTAGKICVFTTAATHLVVDVFGAYTATSHVGLVSGITPSRLFDSRDTGTMVAAGPIHEIAIADRGGVPADAAAVVLSVSVDHPTKAGFLTVYPCGISMPWVSNVNFAADETTSNSAVVAIGTGGKVCMYTSKDTHVVVDVLAAYGPAGPGLLDPSGILRLVDTREGGTPVAAASISEIVVAGRGNIPAEAMAVVLNVAVDDPITDGFITVYPCGIATPVASNVNFSAGETISNTTTVQVGTGGKVCVYTMSSTQLVVDADGSFSATARA